MGVTAGIFLASILLKEMRYLVYIRYLWFTDIVDIYAPLKKFTIKARPAPWLTERIRDLMNLRDAAKLEAKKSGFLSDWAVYRKLRNYML